MAKKQWNKQLFFAELQKECSEDAYKVAHQLLEWCEQQGYSVVYGEGQKEGTMAPAINHENRICKLFEVFTRHNGKSGYVLLTSYLWEKYWPESPFRDDNKRKQMITKFNRLPLNKPLPEDTHHSRPWLTLDTLSNPDTFKAFREVHEWVANEIKG